MGLTKPQTHAIINYKLNQRKEKKKMMYQIIITTANREYAEKHYGLIESINRMLDIAKCDNVEMIDCVCCATGEIMVTIEWGVVTYVAIETIERFYEEM